MWSKTVFADRYIFKIKAPWRNQNIVKKKSMPVHKYEKFFGAQRSKLRFSRILMVDILGDDKKTTIFFFLLAKSLFYFKEVCELPNSFKIVI